MLPRLFRLLVWLLFPLAAHGGLTWDQPAQEFHRAPEDLKLDVLFTFTNTGSAPVEITRVTTSCGCTAARLEKKRFDPNMHGKIDVQFIFGSRRGPQHKTITVSTSDGVQTILELRCFIEDALAIQPALVFWRLDTPPDEKVVELTSTTPDNRIVITAVKSNNPQISSTLETIEAGQRYRLKIRPASTEQKESAQFIIETDFPPDAPKSYTIFARIK